MHNASFILYIPAIIFLRHFIWHTFTFFDTFNRHICSIFCFLLRSRKSEDGSCCSIVTNDELLGQIMSTHYRPSSTVLKNGLHTTHYIITLPLFLNPKTLAKVKLRLNVTYSLCSWVVIMSTYLAYLNYRWKGLFFKNYEQMWKVQQPSYYISVKLKISQSNQFVA